MRRRGGRGGYPFAELERRSDVPGYPTQKWEFPLDGKPYSLKTNRAYCNVAFWEESAVRTWGVTLFESARELIPYLEQMNSCRLAS